MQRPLYALSQAPYTAIQTMLRIRSIFQSCLLPLAVIYLVALAVLPAAGAQEPAQQPTEKPAGKAADPAAKPSAKSDEKKHESAAPENPAQIELLETHVRFEQNGDSRKEVHARVHINSELGVRQFARLNFDYNRSFESIEIPLVRVNHAHGGTSDVLPSAITDNPNPAVVDFPAYQDVRVKSVRILGLQPGDILEYRVVTTVNNPPLAPDFWFDHTFDRTGVVSQEIFEVDIPGSRLVDSPAFRRLEMRINPSTPATVRQETPAGGSLRTIYHWTRQPQKSEKRESEPASDRLQNPDVSLGTFLSWAALSQRLSDLLQKPIKDDMTVSNKAFALTKTINEPTQKMEALYNFVSHELPTVDLPLDATGFRARSPAEILSSGYASPEDKYVVLAALGAAIKLEPEAALAGASDGLQSQLPRPSLFSRILTIWGTWCDPSLEVAPFGLLSPGIRGKQALRVFVPPVSNPLAGVMYTLWFTIPIELPFPAFQKVNVVGTLAGDGRLSAKVQYILRGDNELLLRVAFHKTPKDKWKDLAALLAISDGFRGKIEGISTSDPYATREPFTVDYEITMPKFVDWSKKPVRIPALLPQVALPDPPAKPVPGSAVSPIELGTPLDVETTMTLHLPPGTTAQTPTGTSVERDYATFSSQYAVKNSGVTASRHIHFILREVPGPRVADYNAFLRVVQNDSAQDFTLERSESLPEKTNPAAPKTAAPPNPAPQKP
jgi:Domain of Unknown Function with PDB structure (DUF3857)